MSAKDFAKVFTEVCSISRAHETVLSSVWVGLESRHWDAYYMNQQEWNEIIDAIALGIGKSSADVCAYVHDLIEALSKQGMVLSNAVKAVKNYTNVDAVKSSMYKDFEDLAHTMCYHIDDYNGTLPNATYHWVITYWTLMWMGFTAQDSRTIKNAEVKINDDTITIYHEGVVRTLTSNMAVRIFNYTMKSPSNFRSSSPSPEDPIELSDEYLLRVRYRKLYSDCFALAKEIHGHSGRSVDSYLINRCGYFYRGAQSMKEQGINDPPLQQKALLTLFNYSSTMAPNTFRRWRNEFISWYTLYGDK